MCDSVSVCVSVAVAVNVLVLWHCASERQLIRNSG